MQLLGRPLARAVRGSQNACTSLALKASPRPVQTPQFGFIQHPPSSLRCRATPIRFYSSQPPSKDSTASDKESGPTINLPPPSPTPTEPPAEQQPAEQSKDEVPPPPPPSDQPAEELPSSYERRRSQVNQKFSEIMDTLQSRVLTASQTLNEVTGYSAIEGIKAENDRLEAALAEAHTKLRTARQAYKTSNAKRATTQREVTTLLARKESWSPTDLERFTELYRTDHVLEGEVAHAQEALTEAEAEEQSLAQKLSAGILKRYHEEQIWSDRIRRASTWGTWGLMGMNFLTFLIFQFVAEPWRRKRLVNGVVAAEEQALDEVRGELEAIKASLQAVQANAVSASSAEPEAETLTAPTEDVLVAPILELPEDSATPVTTPIITPTRTWKEFLSDPALWRIAIEDLWSDRQLDLRMKDASVLALEGAVAGATIAAGIFWSLARK